MPTPTISPPPPDSLNSSLRRNIDALRRRRSANKAAAPLADRVAGRIAGFTGSMKFVILHVLIYGFWLVANAGLVPAVEPWDPTYVILAMVASVEAIFLSTFILMSQNRMAAAADRRAELDLQVGLLAEQEITKLVQMVSDISDRLGMDGDSQPDVEEMKRGVAPEAVLDAIENSEREAEQEAT